MLSDPCHHLDHLRVIPLGVHGVRDLGARMAEGELGGLEAEGPTDGSPGVVAELVRM